MQSRRQTDQSRSTGRPCFRLRAPSLASRFRRDEAGATAVELGLIALPFFSILLAILQIGFRFFVAETLDTAVAAGGRQILTGQVQGSSAISTPTQFRDQVLCNPTNRLLPAFMDCSRLVVDVRKLSSFSDAAIASSAADLLSGATTPVFDPGIKGSIIVARAAYSIPAIAPGLTGGGATTIGGSQVYPLLGVFVFRNEPF